MSRLRYLGLAVLLLLVGVAAHFAWHAAPTELQGQAWNASGALFALLLLGLVANAYRQRHVWQVCGLLALWQAMTAACSLAYMARPWVVLPGQAQCSARLDFPLGALSAYLAAILAAELWRLLCRRQ